MASAYEPHTGTYGRELVIVCEKGGRGWLVLWGGGELRVAGRLYQLFRVLFGVGGAI